MGFCSAQNGGNQAVAFAFARFLGYARNDRVVHCLTLVAVNLNNNAKLSRGGRRKQKNSPISPLTALLNKNNSIIINAINL